MSPRQALMLIGIWTMIFLFLGFPIRGEQFLALATGLLILIVAYRLPHVSRLMDSAAIPFVEHKAGSKKQASVPEEVVEIEIVEEDITKPDQSAL